MKLHVIPSRVSSSSLSLPNSHSLFYFFISLLSSILYFSSVLPSHSFIILEPNWSLLESTFYQQWAMYTHYIHFLSVLFFLSLISPFPLSIFFLLYLMISSLVIFSTSLPFLGSLAFFHSRSSLLNFLHENMYLQMIHNDQWSIDIYLTILLSYYLTITLLPVLLFHSSSFTWWSFVWRVNYCFTFQMILSSFQFEPRSNNPLFHLSFLLVLILISLLFFVILIVIKGGKCEIKNKRGKKISSIYLMKNLKCQLLHV